MNFSDIFIIVLPICWHFLKMSACYQFDPVLTQCYWPSCHPVNAGQLIGAMFISNDRRVLCSMSLRVRI